MVVTPQQRLLLFALAIFPLVGCSTGSTPTLAPNVTAAQQTSAANSMGLTFPPKTRFLLYHRASEDDGLVPGPDDAVHLKIELPAAALADFLTQAPLSTANWSSSHTFVDHANWPQWQPSQVQKFRYEQFQLPQGEALNVLIDDDKDDLKVVYLLWFET